MRNSFPSKLTLWMEYSFADLDKGSSILIRKDRPSVFIEFDRSGKAPPLFEGEKEERIWLRLHNNAQWAIEFCSFSLNGE
jgi:hypothetical protein